MYVYCIYIAVLLSNMFYIKYKYIVVLILWKLYENTKTGRFTSFVYICNAIENPVIVKGEFGIPLTCKSVYPRLMLLPVQIQTWISNVICRDLFLCSVS